jgi:simple sugar transport system ATP-binding protein
MQFVEIAREIDKENIKLLVFDEPTAVLTEGEAENLIKAMRNLANQGIAIIFITHRLDEVMTCSEHVVILRDGSLVAYKPTSETNTVELAELMVGRKIDKIVALEESRQFSDELPILEMKNFKVGMPGEMVRGIDLSVRRGEIFGIGGLAGQGKIGISNGLMGLFPARGEVTLNGAPLKLNDPMASLKRKMAFVSEDRKGVGLLLDESIDLNIAITSMQVNNRFLKQMLFFNQIDQTTVDHHANEMVKLFDIRCTGVEQKTRRLSGGNQQKVCLARAITLEPELLLVSEPTRGIDIGAKKLVLDTLIKLNREENMTIIMTSSELGELRSICDRIAIVSEGKLVGVLRPEDSDAKYGLYMSGKTDLPEGVQ